MQSIVVYSAVFVLVALFLLMAVGVGGEFPPGLADLFTTWLPAWLQGIGTVLAAYVAWQALQKWREQDADRRRAEAAEELLRASFTAASAIRAARVISAVPRNITKQPKGIKGVLGLLPQSRMQTMETTVAELRGHLLVAKHHFGREMAGKILALVAVERKVRGAYEHLQVATRVPEFSVNADDLWHRLTEESLEVLGFWFWEDGQPFETPGDDTDGEITQCLMEIESSLEPIVTGKL